MPMQFVQTSWSRKSFSKLIMLIYLIILIVILSILFVKKRYSYWSDNGVPFVKPSFPFGNIRGLGSKIHTSQLIDKLYYELKGKGSFGGVFFFINPAVILLDLELIKRVLVKDFPHFHDRSIYHNEKDDPLSAHLLSIDGEKWRQLRNKFSPTFTSAKMKVMFPTICEVGVNFKQCLEKCIENDPEIEMKDILARFTTDIIGTCAFGINCNSLNNPETEFRRMGRKVFEIPNHRLMKLFFMAAFSNLSRVLRLKRFDDDVTEFFIRAVNETIDFREKYEVERHDFMDLLIRMKQAEDGTSLTRNEIAAQAFIFFLAGFETSSTAMSYCLYELSLNQDMQDKARKCIENSINKHGGLSYEAIMDMPYIEQCINESLRKYPPATNLVRKVTKDYIVPGTTTVLKKGINVFIPTYSIHHDSDYYHDPEKYDPDRFLPAEVAKRNPYSFLPFGEGPRNCIGLRFGMLQALVGLTTLLKDFKFTSCDKSVIPLKISTSNFILTPEGGLWLNVEKISK